MVTKTSKREKTAPTIANFERASVNFYAMHVAIASGKTQIAAEQLKANLNVFRDLGLYAQIGDIAERLGLDNEAADAYAKAGDIERSFHERDGYPGKEALYRKAIRLFGEKSPRHRDDVIKKLQTARLKAQRRDQIFNVILSALSGKLVDGISDKLLDTKRA